MASSVREEILMAAAGLFEAHGYTATSTHAIADEAGLRQASLFHYFARKEDILTELLDRTLRPTLDAVRNDPRMRSAPDVALWSLACTDTANLCRGPRNLGALQLLPEVRGPQFEWFWRRRHQLFRVYVRQIARGCESGDFLRSDSNTTGELVFGLVESVITARPHFRRRATTPVVIADAALRICGVAPSRVRAVARTSHALEGR
ncbi:MAG TPA: TetR/AcrR family transcriptional regulator [Acidimicrobiales bacterium]|jgi:AcrR family transcriptional regulator|nr:TetR/AcrR family transcriptional regulator [Acidimicrobiales bacterium]